MPTVEYRCQGCRIEYEVFRHAAEWPYPDNFPCPSCGANVARYFSRPPGMSPDPHWNGYFDQQLGRYISSRDEKRRILKEKGLEEVSAEEHRRGFEGYSEKEDVIPENDPKFRDAMEKAWADMKAGNLPPVTPRKVDTADSEVSVVS